MGYTWLGQRRALTEVFSCGNRVFCFRWWPRFFMPSFKIQLRSYCFPVRTTCAREAVSWNFCLWRWWSFSTSPISPTMAWNWINSCFSLHSMTSDFVPCRWFFDEAQTDQWRCCWNCCSFKCSKFFTLSLSMVQVPLKHVTWPRRLKKKKQASRRCM